jgi:GTP cyclohydrolase I
MSENKYEWLEDDIKSTVKNPLAETIFSKQYVEPNREYDAELVVNQDYIDSLPDLQQGPSSLIQGSPVAIHQVGIHNFNLPLNFKKKDGGKINLKTSITGTVSLEAHKKGINMSRIMRTFYEYKENDFTLKSLIDILYSYKKKLNSFDANILAHISYPIEQKSLRSGNVGIQYYEITLECDIDKDDNVNSIIHFDFVYSSACPCSYELGEHARQNRNRATVSHSQRSVARISIKSNDLIWFEDIRDMMVDALATETQVIVKREDEQAFAELNGSYLKFVEDAVRLVHEKLDNNSQIEDFKIICSHQESLHSHDAISVLIKGVPGGFTYRTSRAEYNSLIHRPN